MKDHADISTLFKLLQDRCTDLVYQHHEEEIADQAELATCYNIFLEKELSFAARHLQTPPSTSTSVETFPILFSAISLGIVGIFTSVIIFRKLLEKRYHRYRRHDIDVKMTLEEKENSWLGDQNKSEPLVWDSNPGLACIKDTLVVSVDSENGEGTCTSDTNTAESKEDRDTEFEVRLNDEPALRSAVVKLKTGSSSSGRHLSKSCKIESDPVKRRDKKRRPKEKKSGRLEKKNQNVVLSWRGIGCSYPSTHSSREPIVTLHGASGALRTHELTAIMGASGSGKSTLLDILSGRKNLGVLEGEMSIEGNVVGIAEAGTILKNVAAYVPQNEMFFPTQTPEEAVMFFANLKLGRDIRGQAYRHNSISNLLDQVGLSVTTRTRPIGGALAGGLTIRGLSGGERKRLALACAVAMKPSILFLDEITSGLDSENAVNVTRLLQRLCRSMSVAAAVVIHQPSDKVFQLFDQLILLSKGRCIFSDQLSAIPEWYTTVLMQPMPQSHLIADDLLKQSTSWEHFECDARSQEFEPLVLTQPMNCRITSSKYLVGTTTSWTFACIFYRNLENHYVRNISNLTARIIIYAATSFLLGLVFWQVGDHDIDTLDNTNGQIVMGAGLFLAEASILLPFAQIGTFFFDKKVFAAENALGLYEPWMYAVSQFLLEAWVLVICAFVQAAISIPMVALWNPVWSSFESFFTMVSFFCVSGLVGNAVILLISMISLSQDVAFLGGAMYVTVGLATSGGFVPFASMPNWIRWLQWISAIKYSLQTFAQSTFDGTYVTLVEDLDLDRPDSITLNLLVQLGMFFIFASFSIVFLSLQKERR